MQYTKLNVVMQWQIDLVVDFCALGVEESDK